MFTVDELHNIYTYLCIHVYESPTVYVLLCLQLVSYIIYIHICVYMYMNHLQYYVLLCLQLVSSFQLEAQTRQHEAEQIRTKLSSVRKMIAKLLKSINEVW